MSTDDFNDELEALPKGFRKRTLATAKLAGRLGFSYARRAIRGRAGPVNREAAIKSALEIVEQVGKLKGVAMKVGQIASYVPGAFPPEAQKILSKLQVTSTPLRFEKIEEIVTGELGGKLSDVFEDFERVPVAAASIGQVHRARLQGRTVAVKVQYPDVEELIAGDLKTLRRIAPLLVVGTPNDGAALANELRARMLEECDYLLEGRRQKLFAELYGKVPDCRVPEVFMEQSTRRVLTTEWVEGADFQSFIEKAPQETKDRAGTAIFNAVFKTLFNHAIYNGDPHPGNYLFDEAGRVTFLDFGCVREFSRDFLENWKPMERAMHARDKEGVRRTFPKTGMMGVAEHKFDWDLHWEVMEYLCRPYQPPQPFRFTQSYVQESYDRVLFNNDVAKMIATPPEWLLINRVHWGLNSVLGRLEAQADWGDHWHAAIWSETDPIRCP